MDRADRCFRFDNVKNWFSRLVMQIFSGIIGHHTECEMSLLRLQVVNRRLILKISTYSLSWKFDFFMMAPSLSKSPISTTNKSSKLWKWRNSHATETNLVINKELLDTYAGIKMVDCFQLCIFLSTQKVFSFSRYCSHLNANAMLKPWKCPQCGTIGRRFSLSLMCVRKESFCS